MPHEALAAIAICYGVTALCALSIAVPHLVVAIRMGGVRDGYGWFRAKTVLLFGAVGIGTGRTAAIFADYVWFDQAFFGPLDDRWGFDLVIAVAVMVAVLIATVLYWRTQFEGAP